MICLLQLCQAVRWREGPVWVAWQYLHQSSRDAWCVGICWTGRLKRQIYDWRGASFTSPVFQAGTFCVQSSMKTWSAAALHWPLVRHVISKTAPITYTRSSATAEKQCVSCPHGGGPRPSNPLPLCPIWLYTYAYGRIQKPQQTYTSSVPSTKCTLRWIRHWRSFKVILIGAGRNPEWSVVVMCN